MSVPIGRLVRVPHTVEAFVALWQALDALEAASPQDDAFTLDAELRAREAMLTSERPPR
jgi:hypothetical protein